MFGKGSRLPRFVDAQLKLEWAPGRFIHLANIVREADRLFDGPAILDGAAHRRWLVDGKRSRVRKRNPAIQIEITPSDRIANGSESLAKRPLVVIIGVAVNMIRRIDRVEGESDCRGDIHIGRGFKMVRV